jgi:hypothetical protein
MTEIRNIEVADARSRTELAATWNTLTATWPRVQVTAQVGPLVPGEFLDLWSFLSDDYHGTMGVTNTQRKLCDILIVADYAEDYGHWKREVKEAQAKGFLSTADIVGQAPAQYTLTHEFGHALARNVLGDFDRNQHPYREAALLAWHTLGMHTDVTTTRRVPAVWNEQADAAGAGTWPLLATDLSQYAISGPQELLAEAFAVGHLAPGHSKAADAVCAWLNERYQEAQVQHRAA